MLIAGMLSQVKFVDTFCEKLSRGGKVLTTGRASNDYGIKMERAHVGNLCGMRLEVSGELVRSTHSCVWQSEAIVFIKAG